MNILLCVSGSIAAYKSVELLRKLQTLHTVRIVMTPAASRFITPLTLHTISGSPANIEETSDPLAHIELAKWADLALVAPATANTIAKLANGIADNLLTSVLLAVSPDKIVVMPAMNTAMYKNMATQNNIRILKERGVWVGETSTGQLACGDVGEGKLLSLEEIVALVELRLADGFLKGRSVLISAGPTKENIDSARFISNRSSGLMGYALASAAFRAGADVTLVSGCVSIDTPIKNTIYVESAADMEREILRCAKTADIIIMAAAVSDFTPKIICSNKIKKTKSYTLELVETRDILKSIAKNKKAGQFLVGFAAETENLKENACKKLKEKELDMIVANDVSRSDIGFSSEDNEVTIFYKDKPAEFISKCSKARIAELVVKRISETVQ